MIVLDEPNANLDEAGEAALIQTVQNMKAKGKTVIVITHRPGILAVADRVLVLMEGKVKAQGPRDAVIAALRAATQAAPKAPAAGPSAGLTPV